jgi:hypothetical protein
MKIKSFYSFLNENSSTSFVDDELVEKLDEDLYGEIKEYISDNIVNWGNAIENANCEEEADAIQFFGENEKYARYWRIYPDGTLNVILSSDNMKTEDDWVYSYEMDGEDQEGNFLDALSGDVSIQFDDKSTSGDNELNYELEEKVKKFFREKRGTIQGTKFGL